MENNMDDSEEEEMAKSRQKRDSKKKKSGGFQSMSLSHAVIKGILRRGYKIPTPIQRKTIPIILEGKDVVAMARTGSGKTAAFLVPMFERLKLHSSLGVRAVVLSPTRELALQTLKFAKEIGKFTGLKAAVVLGGDKMDDQFAALHDNPDIIIATPGRLLHVLVEMDTKLKTVEYVVFDEADRLFEMGFKDQLQEIIHRFPDSRQTVLFSATLPKTLVEFARAGLTEPTLIRLDVDTKLSENLKLTFLSCRDADKCALLIYLLKHVIKPREQTVVFVATKHHVEYLNLLLTLSGLSVTYIYSSLDPAARKINAAKFSRGKVNVLLVTDLAARGIDIPLLDNVINFHFPGKSKLFVHRVGRVARAGRSGVAYSLVGPDELAHLVDLHLFLGRPINFMPLDPQGVEVQDNACLGEVPQSLLDDEDAEILQLQKESVDLTNLIRVCANAYKKYIKSRPAPAPESVKRVKKMAEEGVRLGHHPLFCNKIIEEQGVRLELLNAMKHYKPKLTIFEINSTAKKTGLEVMKAKRAQHDQILVSNEARRKQQQTDLLSAASSTVFPAVGAERTLQKTLLADEGDIQTVFSNTVSSSRKSKGSLQPQEKKKKPVETVDQDNFIQYRPSDFASERGFMVTNTFERQAASAVLDLTNDESANSGNKNKRHWDRKKKKFVTEHVDDAKKKRIKTESGNWIPSSYKSNAYHDWRHRTKVQERDDGDNSGGEEVQKGQRKMGPNSFQDGRFTVAGTRRRNWHTTTGQGQAASSRQNKMKFKSGKRGELKSADQILKNRRRKTQIQNFQKHRQNIKEKRKGKEFSGKKQFSGKKNKNSGQKRSRN